MSIIEAVLQGVLQGLTEFLPVSSSGHLSIFQYFTGQSGHSGALFSILLHLGTLLAVTLAFWPRIRRLIVGFFSMLPALFRREIDFSHPDPVYKEIFLLITGLLPLGFTFLIKDWLQSFSSDNDIVVEGLCLIATGVVLFFAGRRDNGRKKAPSMTYTDALIVGCAQAIAPLPGLSRSGVTLSAALLLGLDKRFAMGYSFILGIPAVCGAVLLDIKDIFGMTDIVGALPLLLGFVTSAVVGILSIRLMRYVVDSGRLNLFSAYTLSVGTLVLALGLYDRMAGYPLIGAITF